MSAPQYVLDARARNDKSELESLGLKPVRQKAKPFRTKNRARKDQAQLNIYLDAIPYQYRLQVIQAYNKRFLLGAIRDYKGDWWELKSSRTNANEYLRAVATKARSKEVNHAH